MIFAFKFGVFPKIFQLRHFSQDKQIALPRLAMDLSFRWLKLRQRKT
jgi:hypothetical protein